LEKKKKTKKSRRKKLLYWLLVDLLVVGVVCGLLFWRPSQYNPVVSTAMAGDDDEVHPYLSHQLAPALYNGAQSQRSFEMELLDKGLTEAISDEMWPQQAEGISFYAPAVVFKPGRILLMGTADIEGAGFVVTVELQPEIDDGGLININVSKVKIGAMNITPLAKMMGQKMYRQRVESMEVDTEDIRTKIAASLFNAEAFDPVFQVEDKWVRLKEIEIIDGKVLARLDPAKPPRR